ncbi:MAG: hypothetical protein CL840_22030 [Crocinitomicaceae bacterium]|nr:hypothetical protein [Crocinitomicaceae bacterium]|tara:strand:+ start:6040 stop:7041 length:1002 start_codon:yes stop_codon:yes gene_type:complete
MQTVDNSQIDLLEEISKKLNNKRRLVDCLAETLCISTDSAYRRISGKTALTFDEAVKLASYFDLKLDGLVEKSGGTVSFDRRGILKTENDIAIHLKEMAEMMKIQIATGVQPAIYTTKDIPVFYQLYFPELAAFKVYSWYRGLNTSEELNDPFDPDKYISSYKNLFTDIKILYSKLPAIEIWSEIAILGFIRQLQYYYDSGLMGNKETALLLCDQHQQVFDLVKEQARLGCKINPDFGQQTEVQYDLYFNELFVMDNSALSRLKSGKVFFNSYANFNYIPTQDEQFCQDAESWLQNQMKRSVKLSKTREKERNMFFSKIQKELNELSNYIRSN